MSRIRTLSWVVSLFIATLVVALSCPGVALAADGHIQGLVTAAGPRDGIDVVPCVESPPGSGWYQEHWELATSTSGGGLYDLTLPPGTYRLRFVDPSGTWGYQFWPNEILPYVGPHQDIVVGDGATVAGVNEDLPVAATIIGSVETAGFVRLQDIDVVAYADVDGRWSGVVGARTDSSGNYELKGLPPGTFAVRFDDTLAHAYASEFCQDVSPWRYDLAQKFTLEAGGMDWAYAYLEPAATISGTLTGGGVPIPWAGAGLAVDAGDGSWPIVQWAQPDAGTGAWAFEGLPAGTYRLYFHDTAWNFIAECWENKPSDIMQGDDIVLGPGGSAVCDADLDPAGHIAGAVYGEGAGALENAWVSANVEQDGGYYAVNWAATAPDGTYSIGGLATGSYLVRFDAGPAWVAEVYDDVQAWEDGLPVDVTAGTTTSPVDATLSIAAHITGTVTGGGGPLENITVLPLVWRDDGGGGGWWEQHWELSATTNGSGAYDIGGLAAGTYRLMFVDTMGTWATEYYDDAMTASGGQDIKLDPAGAYVADAELAEAGAIAGRVTSDGVNGIENIQVATGPFDVGTGYFEHIAWAQTDANGYYTLPGLQAGTYRVQFWDNDGVYVGETYDDVTDWRLGTDVEVTAGATHGGIDAELSAGAHISGTVIGEGGFGPIEGIQVVPMRLEGYDDAGNPRWNHRWDRAASTDGTGFYEITGLEAGAWSVMFSGGDTGWATEYWDDTFMQRYAVPFDLTIGGEATSVNAELVRAGWISGTAVGLGADPPSVEGLQVVAVDPSTGEHMAWAQTEADGSYRLTGLRPGSYLVWCQGSWDWVGEWWQEAVSQETATPVDVVADSATPDIDFTLDVACRISGIVTPEGGGSFGPAGTVNAVPMVWRDDGWGGGWWEPMWDNPGGVNPDGSYTIGGLAPGTYRVMFAADPMLWATEFWNDKTTPAQGDDITLAPAEIRTGIDAVLAPASFISGRVTGDDAPDGIPYANVEVAVFDPATDMWDSFAWAQADEDGYYVVGGLPAGEYGVSFSDPVGMYLTEAYDDAYDWHEATPVHTDPSTPAENIDAVLSAAAYISGTVYGEGEPNPLPWIDVTVFERYPDGGLEWLGSVQTDKNGQYLFGGLWGSDSYLVQFTDWSGEWAIESYADASSWMWGDEVSAWPGSPAEGIDVTLERAGMIVGTVYGGEGTDNPLPNAGVAVGPYDSASDQWDGWFGYGEVFPAGTYVIRGLKPGVAYRIVGSDNDGVYAASFYDGGTNDYHTGTDIYPISGDSVVADIHLPMGGHITGTVTDGVDPIADIAVFLYHEDPWSGFDDFWSSFDGVQASTDGNGNYDVGGLSPGNYRIGFGDMAHGVYASEIWDDAPLLAMGDTITISSYGEVSGGHDAVLSLGGTIEGTVTDHLGSPLKGVWVSAAIMRDVGWWEGADGWSAETDELGHYVINAGLRPEDALYVQAQSWDGNWLGEWWQESPGFDAATPVHVPAGGSLTGIDFTLDPAAHIIGNVSGDDGGGLAGLPQIDVQAFAFNGEWWDWVGGSQTDMFGDYDVGGLAPDVEYRLWFSDWTGYWGAEGYDDKPSWQWGDGVVPTLADPAVADATLERAGAIIGTVSGDGVPLTNAQVVAGPFDLVTDQWDPWAWDDTDENGMYSLVGLAPGVYKVQAWDDSGVYAGTFYLDQGGDWHDGTGVIVTAGLTTVADFNLHLAGHITGTVTDGADPIMGIPVFLYKPGPDGTFDDFWSSFQGEQAQTDENGDYDIGGLLPGEYRVGFGDYTDTYAGEVWNDAPVLPMGDTITIGAYGEMESDKDAVLSVSGSITGHVYDAVGDPIEGIELGALVVDDATGDVWGVGRNGVSDATGLYEITGLRAQDDVIVQASAPNGMYGMEFYDGVTDLASATPINVPAGGTQENIDFTLETAGWVGGTITLERPADGFGSIAIGVYKDVGGAWEWIGGMMGGGVNPDGTWLVGGLPEGECYVEFWDGNGQYAYEIWDDAITRADADPVTVIAGATAYVDCYLELAGAFSGTVTNGTGPVQGIEVTALVWDGADWVPTVGGPAETDLYGEYDVGIRSGTYRVEFSDPSGTYLTQYYNGAESAALGDDVVVTAPDEHTGVDAVMVLDNDPPVADAGGPYAGGEGVAMQLDGSSSYDPNAPLDDIETYEWDLDGDRDFNDASGETTQVVFPDDGVFEVALRVTDGFGLTDEDTATVTVANAAPTLGTISVSDSSPDVGQAIDFSVDFDDPGTLDTHTVEWDWGDGDASGPDAAGGGVATGSHTYGLAGTFTATCTVTDDDGDTGEQTIELTVTAVNAPPVAVADSYTMAEDTVLTVTAPGVLGNDSDPDSDALTASPDGDPAHGTHTLNANGSFTYTPDPDWFGTDTFYYTALDGRGGSDRAAVTITVTDVPEPPTGLTVTPVAGTNRIGTAVKASELAFPAGAKTVVVATAFNWPDALGGAALAGAVDGPILLTSPTALPGEVAAEIARLGADRAYILGGTAAVGTGVESALKAQLGASDVTRLAGAGRYETARKIAAECVDVQGAAYDGTAFVATGLNFPDALGASPLAAANGWPIYLVGPTGADATLIGAMRADGVDTILVLGGTGVVTDTVKNGLAAGVPASAERLAGANRYATACVVATYGVDHAGLFWDKLAIATGQNFPDALAGGVLQGKSGSVMLLTPTASLDGGVRGILTANKATINEVRFLGGTGAISTAVRTAVAAALK